MSVRISYISATSLERTSGSPSFIKLCRDETSFWEIAIGPGGSYMWPFGGIPDDFPALLDGQRLNVRVEPMSDCSVEIACDSDRDGSYLEIFRFEDGRLTHSRTPRYAINPSPADPSGDTPRRCPSE